MNECRRFEEEALVRIERGLPLDPHFETCETCVAARAQYDRLRENLAMAAPTEKPPPGWQGRVWRQIEDERHSQTVWHRRWRRVGAPAAAVLLIAALGAAGLYFYPPGAASMNFEVTAAEGPPRRGDTFKVGDRLTVRARTGGAGYFEVRVYRHDDELVLRCSAEPPCVKRGRRVRADVTLDGAGTYRAFFLVSEAPLPDPIPDRDGDARQALAAGASVLPGKAIRVD